jgi:hypothetical protein
MTRAKKADRLPANARLPDTGRGPLNRALMLDFDGVLHPAQGSDSPEFGLVGLLEKALENQDCAIVISSTGTARASPG